MPEEIAPVSRVLVPREELLSGRLDLSSLLRAAPPHLLDAMRTAVAGVARRFQVTAH